MNKEILTDIFSNLNKENIKFFISGDSNKLTRKYPKIKLPEGRNELNYLKEIPYPSKLIEHLELNVRKEDVQKAAKILRQAGFYFYPFSKPFLSYFFYDRYLGFLNIDILQTKDFSNLKKIKNFYISLANINKQNRKYFTSHLFKGRLICFEAPEGGGKTSTTSAAYTILQNFPAGRRWDTSSSFKDSRLYRIYDLSKKLFQIYLNKIRGRITLLDRYVYLTFRNNNFLREILLFLAPTPDRVFIMKAPYEVLKKRRGPLCKPESEVNEIYRLFNKAKNKTIIDSEKPIEENLGIIINTILKMYDNPKSELKTIRKIQN